MANHRGAALGHAAADGWLHAANAVLGVRKMVYRQLAFGGERVCSPAREPRSGGNVHVGLAPFRHQNSRSDARARRPAVGADAGRPRRRGDQDRAAGRRRRRARLRAALSGRSRGQGEQQQLVLSVRQPQQEIGHRQYRHAGGPGDHPRAGKILRRHDGELQGRRSQALQARLRIDQGRQSRHHLLLGDRLRPDRTLTRRAPATTRSCRRWAG